MDKTENTVKNSRKRCFLCKKKQLIVHKCKCGKYFCLSHKYSDTHNCPYKEIYKMHKEMNMPCVPQKIEKI